MQIVVIKIDVLRQDGVNKYVLGCLLWQTALLFLLKKAIEASHIYKPPSYSQTVRGEICRF